MINNKINIFFFLRKFLILSILVVCSDSYATKNDPIQTTNSSNNYVLLISACPTWKTLMTEFCQNGVTQLSNILTKRMNLPQDNINIILNENATYQGIKEGFAWLKEKTDNHPNSRAIVYMNLHGGPEPIDMFSSKPDSLWADFINRHKEHEMFVLWSANKPMTVGDALEKKEWILATEIRKILDPISSEKIIIIDACHAGLSGNDLLNYSNTPKKNQREAYIFSTNFISDSQANFQKKIALFTSYLIEGIGQKDTLEAAFKMARDSTIITSSRNAIDEKLLKNSCLIHGGSGICQEWPIQHDPYHLLEKVHFSNHH